jgi:hypothetical protein
LIDTVVPAGFCSPFLARLRGESSTDVAVHAEKPIALADAVQGGLAA